MPGAEDFVGRQPEDLEGVPRTVFGKRFDALDGGGFFMDADA